MNEDKWGSSVGMYIDNSEYVDVKLDAEDKVLEGTKKDGTKYIAPDLLINGNIKSSMLDLELLTNPDFIQLNTDINGKILSGRKSDGTIFENNIFEFNSAIIDGYSSMIPVYGENGEIIKITTIYHDGSIEIENYEYSGSMITNIKTYINDKIRCVTTFEYDNNGNIIKINNIK